MKKTKVFLLFLMLALSLPSKAQENLQAYEILFVTDMAFHDAVVVSIEELCPKYKFQSASNSKFIDSFKANNSETRSLLNKMENEIKIIAHSHAMQIIINAGGCETETFKISVGQIEFHQTMLRSRAEHKRFTW